MVPASSLLLHMTSMTDKNSNILLLDQLYLLQVRCCCACLYKQLQHYWSTHSTSDSVADTSLHCWVRHSSPYT